MKYFRMSYDEIVFKRSYVNIILLNRSIPSFNFNDDDDKVRENGRKNEKAREQFKHESLLFESLM